MDVLDHVRAVWRRRWIVLVVALACAGTTYAALAARPDRFVARSVVAVSLVPPGGGQYDDATVGYLSRSYADLAVTRPVLGAALARSGVHMGLAEVARRVSAASPSGDGFVTITASGAGAGTVKSLAQGVAEALVAAAEAEQSADATADLNRVNAQAAVITGDLGGASGTAALQATATGAYAPLLTAAAAGQTPATPRLAIVSAATTTTKAPRPGRYALFAFVAGVFVAGESAVAEAALRGRLRPDDLRGELVPGLPVLASVRRRGGKAASVDASRALRTRIRATRGTSGSHTIAVVDVTTGAGAASVALRLAESFADLGADVLIVDGDLRGPQPHQWLDVPATPGLSDVLSAKRGTTTGTIRRVGDHLRALPAGTPVDDPAALLSLGMRSGVFARALQDELVIVRTAAADRCSDALAVAAQCDLTVLVASYRTTGRRAVSGALRGLQLVGANVLGAVVTSAPRRPRGAPG